jgi:hypothetical protein
MKEASISDEVDDNLNDISLNILNSLGRRPKSYFFIP